MLLKTSLLLTFILMKIQGAEYHYLHTADEETEAWRLQHLVKQ